MKTFQLFIISIAASVILTSCGKEPSSSDVKEKVKLFWESKSAYDLLVKNDKVYGKLKYIPKNNTKANIDKVEIIKWGDKSEKGDKQKIEIEVTGSVNVIELIDTKGHLNYKARTIDEYNFMRALDYKEVDKGNETFTAKFNAVFVKDDYGKWHLDDNVNLIE